MAGFRVEHGREILIEPIYADVPYAHKITADYTWLSSELFTGLAYIASRCSDMPLVSPSDLLGCGLNLRLYDQDNDDWSAETWDDSKVGDTVVLMAGKMTAPSPEGFFSKLVKIPAAFDSITFKHDHKDYEKLLNPDVYMTKNISYDSDDPFEGFLVLSVNGRAMSLRKWCEIISPYMRSQVNPGGQH